MKILITGRNGQLASSITNFFKEKRCKLGKIDRPYITSEVKSVDKNTLDIIHLEDVKNYLHEFKPNIVINTAGYTDVDGCEKNIDLAFKVNALGSRNLAIACEEVGSKLVHISTDYVFKGKGKCPYREFNLPNPINMYGKSKYLGEEYIKQACSQYFIVRTGCLYGYSGKNFVKTIIKAAKEKGQLHVVNDQIGNPTNAEDLVYHIFKIALTDEYGIYHCTGNGECNWYEFACEIVKYANIECIVNPINSSELKNAAERPAYSSLDNMMLRFTVGDKMRYWKEALLEFIQRINSDNYRQTISKL